MMLRICVLTLSIFCLGPSAFGQTAAAVTNVVTVTNTVTLTNIVTVTNAVTGTNAAATTTTTNALRAAGLTNAPKKSLWETSATLGLTLTRGNSRTLLVVGNLNSVRKWGGKNELDLGADLAYGENNGVKNAESERGKVQYNRMFSERLFGYLRVEALHDAIAAIDYRVAVSPGAGYYLIKATNAMLRAEIGPGYITERLAGKYQNYCTLRLAEAGEYKFNPRARLWESVEFLPQVDRFENYIINAEVGLETAITKHLSQKTYLQDTFNSEPAAGHLHNDAKLVAALSFKF